MKIVLPIFYLPPISWFAQFFREDAEVILEIHENFPKQTYRNRAIIYGANGALALIIPISHTGERAMCKIKVSSRERWQQLHWKSIKTAYQTSPYFEFYEDRLEKIFTFKSESLTEFNLHALSVLQDLFKTDVQYTFTDKYEAAPEGRDFRSAISAKMKSSQAFEEYFQSFQTKYGFLADLSVVDLLCNKGPESLTYIKKHLF